VIPARKERAGTVHVGRLNEGQKYLVSFYLFPTMITNRGLLIKQDRGEYYDTEDLITGEKRRLDKLKIVNAIPVRTAEELEC
jgi:hypothetical protein